MMNGKGVSAKNRRKGERRVSEDKKRLEQKKRQTNAPKRYCPIAWINTLLIIIVFIGSVRPPFTWFDGCIVPARRLI